MLASRCHSLRAIIERLVRIARFSGPLIHKGRCTGDGAFIITSRNHVCFVYVFDQSG